MTSAVTTANIALTGGAVPPLNTATAATAATTTVATAGAIPPTIASHQLPGIIPQPNAATGALGGNINNNAITPIGGVTGVTPTSQQQQMTAAALCKFSIFFV